MFYKGAAKRLESRDITEAGAMIDVGEDEIHAVMEVETRGGGYDSQGRVKMLFEPHVFWRELGPGPKREQAAELGLAYPKWGMQGYPTDSYPRFERARKIDEDAAIRSSSWALGQVMGFNCRLAGYPTARAMVEAFAESERVQLMGMVQFIISAGLDDELRRHDWRGFARGYNGAGYAKHGYHTKLERAFRKWQKIPDTQFPDIQLMKEQRSGAGTDWFAVQSWLNEAGFSPGPLDGVYGPKTKEALVKYGLQEIESRLRG